MFSVFHRKMVKNYYYYIIVHRRQDWQLNDNLKKKLCLINIDV